MEIQEFWTVLDCGMNCALIYRKSHEPNKRRVCLDESISMRLYNTLHLHTPVSLLSENARSEGLWLVSLPKRELKDDATQ